MLDAQCSMLDAAAEGGLGLLVKTNKQEFLCHFERAELIMLEHGEEKRYSTKFVVLDGSNEIAAVHQTNR
jgi:hypothetical protein